MKIAEERAKAYAQIWNLIRLDYQGEYTNNELIEIAKSRGAQYYGLILSHMKKSEHLYLEKIGQRKVKRNKLDLWRFTGKPIHYTFFIDVFNYYSSIKKGHKNLNSETRNIATANKDNTNSYFKIIDYLFPKNAIVPVHYNTIYNYVHQGARSSSWTTDETRKMVNQILHYGLRNKLIAKKSNLTWIRISDNENFVDNTDEESIKDRCVNNLTDSELATILRMRGYEVKATKYIEL